MSETIGSEQISRRRALSFLGLAALSLAVPLVAAAPKAAAQQPTPTPGAAPTIPSVPKTGTERRQERRTRRVKRRADVRRRRREAHKKGRKDRRELRRAASQDKK
jgi:hypothetical protein